MGMQQCLTPGRKVWQNYTCIILLGISVKDTLANVQNDICTELLIVALLVMLNVVGRILRQNQDSQPPSPQFMSCVTPSLNTNRICEYDQILLLGLGYII